MEIMLSGIDVMRHPCRSAQPFQMQHPEQKHDVKHVSAILVIRIQVLY
jgi:hypothetical protein